MTENKQSLLSILAFVGLFAFSSFASARDLVRPFIIGGVAFGGETLVSTTGPDLDAGGLIYFGGGAIVDPPDSNLAFQFSIGYKFDTIEFSGPSGDSKISSIPLDGMLFLKADALRFGVGLTYYMDPEWELCFDSGGCGTVNFDDAMGVAFEIRHQISDIVFWGGRYTSVDFEANGVSVDANSLRLHVGMIF